MVSRTAGTKIFVPPAPPTAKAPSVSRGDLRFLVGEAAEADRSIREGNRDRYQFGRKAAFASVICRMMKISRPDLDRYMDYVYDETVVKGERLMNLEEPQVWIRKNTA